MPPGCRCRSSRAPPRRPRRSIRSAGRRRRPRLRQQSRAVWRARGRSRLRRKQSPSRRREPTGWPRGGGAGRAPCRQSSGRSGQVKFGPILAWMPPRPKSAFLCQQCGFQSPKWIGRCPSCDGWNTFVEERVVAPSKGRGLARAPRAPITMRARRFGIASDGILVLAETDLGSVIEAIRRVRPIFAVVDSIQTMNSDEIASGAGGVSQLRECTARLLELAKGEDVPIFLVGHVTKEGAVAGPRVLEHIVDAVLYLEGERFHAFRILRATKNRFGSTDEVGVFEMAETGLREVANPSEVFLEERSRGVAGSVIVPTVEGTRPLLVEVQALVTPTSFGLPRRTVNGADPQRVLLLLAVLAKRAGLSAGNHDVYVNLVGGLRIREPAADLGLAVAVASALRDRPADPRTVFVGELGLGGELRRVQRIAARLKEAERLGFERAVVPSASISDLNGTGLEVKGVATLREALENAGVADR